MLLPLPSHRQHQATPRRCFRTTRRCKTLLLWDSTLLGALSPSRLKNLPTPLRRCKALILRDYTLLWMLSIGFELMELTFQHMLPNFNECWWDSWILDVAVCNFIGIYTGMKVLLETPASFADGFKMGQHGQ